MSFSNIHISQFRLEAPSTRFYANGNHQCHVRVKILKLGFNNNTGMLVRIPLTAQEKNSVSTALLSSSLDNNLLAMPQRWGVTSVRNEFSLGLVNQSQQNLQSTWSCTPDDQYDEEFKNEPCFSMTEMQEMQEMQEISADSMLETEAVQENIVPEIIDLYVTATATGVQTIMASAQIEISVNGQLRAITVTTNMNSGNNIFNSRINLEAIPPFAIQPNMLSNSHQLIQDRREYVTKWDVHHQQVTLFRWALPFGMRITRYVCGNDTAIFARSGHDPQPGRFLTNTRFYRSGDSDVNARDQMYGGCVWDFSYRVNVPVNQMVVSVLHVTGCSWTYIRNFPGHHTVRFIDNFGNQHGFFFAPEDSGRRVSIIRIKD